MRVPIRSEREAYLFVVGTVAVVVVSVLIGWLIDPVLGGVVFAVAVVVALIAYLRAPNPDRRMSLREAAEAQHPHGAGAGERHVLVIANEVLSGEELRERLHEADGDRLEVDVLAPVLTSHLRHGVSDVDAGIAQARDRLERSLTWMDQIGISARGEVGDPSPASAIEDELRDFGADEIIVVTHERDRETWQERGELARLRSELDLPITHLEVGDGGRNAQTGLPSP